MPTRDPYDPMVAFDDIYVGEPADPEPPEPSSRYDRARLERAARAILRESARRRLAAPRSQVRVVVGEDPTPRSFSVKMSKLVPSGFDYSHYNALVDKGYVSDYSVIGASAPADGRFPLFDAIRKRYAEALPRPKHVRWDDERTYVGFREERKKARIEDLEKRLAALESQVADHVSDDHGGGKLARLEQAFSDHVNWWHAPTVDILGEAVQVGGVRVPLPLPSWARGKIECWQDGREILCTARFPNLAGETRFVTTATEVSPHVDEAMGGAMRARVPVEDFVDVAPRVVQVLAGTALLSQLCGAAEELISAPGAIDTYVGVLEPSTDPGVAAAMTLLQRCQRGDRRARREAEVMAQRNEAFLRDAGDKLLRAQVQKRRRRA